MGNNNLQMGIEVKANVTGQETVEQLTNRLEDASKVLGGDLKDRAQQAATELRRLADQEAAIQAFLKLRSEAASAAQALKDAEREATNYGKQITAAGPPTDREATALQKLRDAAGDASTKLGQQQQALAGAGADLQRYGIASQSTQAALARLAKETQAVRDGVQATIPGFQAAGTEGATSARQIQDAWSTLGAKSFTQAQAEIAKVRAALETVKATSKSPLEIKMATAAAEERIKQLEGGIHSVGTATSGVSGMLRQLGPLMAATFSAQQFIGTITAAESLSRSYEQVFGSTAKARQEMEFIRATANRLGLETLDLANSYQSLAASTKGTVLEGQATRDVFEAVSRAMSSLGKSSAETNRALTAVSQIASKGTASMEELRGQLGEALPGAMKAAADGAGLTVEQLVEMVSNGDVLAKEILPALTKGLNDLYGKAAPPQTVISEWARFKNEITETSILMGESGLSDAMAKGLSGLATGAKYATANFDVLNTMLGDLGIALVRGNLEGSRAWDVIEKYRAKLGDTADAAGKAAIAQTGLAAAQGTVSVSAQESFRHQELMAQKLDASAESGLKVRQRYLELINSSGAYVAQVEKEVAARNAESTVLTQLVSVYGTEIEKRQVAVGAAQAQAAAADKLASARNTEALVAASYVIKLREQALATGDVTDATKKQIEEAQKSAAAKQTEFERTDALAKAKRIEAEATKAQSQAQQDNSSRVYEYRAAVGAAAREVERLTELHKQGRATDGQVTDARAKLAAATLLYRDALTDATRAAEANIAIQQRAGQMAQAVISVDQERVKAAIEVATALGESSKATQLETELTNLQVRAAQAQAQAARNEAAAMREAADARETELRARGELTAAAQLEIDAMRQAADLKDIEGQKSDILADKTLALAGAHGKVTAALDEQNAAIKRNREELKLLGEATTAWYNSVPQQLARKSTAGELGAGDLADAQQSFDAAKSNLTKVQAAGTSVRLEDFQDAMRAYNEARNILERVKALAGAAGGSTTHAPTSGLDEFASIVESKTGWNPKNWKSDGDTTPKWFADIVNPQSTMPTPTDTLTAQQRQLQEAGARPGETLQQAIKRQVDEAANASGTNRTNTQAETTVKVYKVAIDIGGRSFTGRYDSDADARGLIEALQNSKLSSGL